ncbi:proliferating cell nuclear antigen-like [Carex rostrata]
MLELRLSQGVLLKKILESVKDLLSNVNFDCSSSDGLCLQSMDSSHVALVSLQLLPHSFERFRCDRNLTMGINLAHLSRLLKCAANEDVITIKADDQNPDTMSLMFENPKHDRISDFEMKLMDIESEHLHIPDTSYEATVRMPSQEFARICKDLSTIGDTVVISITKEGVKFSVSGAIGNANIICRHNISVVKPDESTVIEMKEPVSLSFPLRYLNSFTKSTPLSSNVIISMSHDLPMVVEYKISGAGYMRFYLAPKVEDEAMEA